jgi:hypothetical protein
MTGRRYYITTLADWHRHAHRFARSHWLALSSASPSDTSADRCDAAVGARYAVPERADSTAAPFSRELADALCAGHNEAANDNALCTAHDAIANAVNANSIDDAPANGPIAPSSIAGHGCAVPLLNPAKPPANADAICATPHDAAPDTDACDAQPPDVDAGTRILVLVDADEGVHLALDDDAAFEALPHPFAPKAISHAAHEALAAHGVTPGSTTFDAAEAVARAHPLLRPRVF